MQPHTTLGPYQVTAKIGEGGMGEVWQARDTKLDRDVALKVLPEAFTTDPDRLARFEREAKVLASLNHPNIGSIYGLEEAEGGKFRALVLELVEGPTLADRIKQGPIPLDEALPIAKQIADALEAAHEQGVIHRDLKPANVKVKDDGTVKVLDFGLAKALQPDPASAAAANSQTISLTAAATQMGMVIGTAAYMSPEQAKGKIADKRADVWAFGVVLYEMLTGGKAFAGETVSETLADVMKSEPRWDALPADLPPTLHNLVRRCLEKDPTERVRDIGDVRLAMKGAFETTVSTPSEPTAPPNLQVWQRPIPAAIAVLVALLLGGFAVWASTRPAPPRVARFPIPLAADQTFNYTGRPLVAISPDGAQVVYEAQGLWLRPIDQLQATQLPGTDEGRGPFFSPDGQSIGFWAPGQLKKVAVSGGTPVTIADVLSNPSGASWGADDMILFGQPEGIMQVPGASGTPELLIPANDGEILHGPQMLPGDEWVLFTVRAGGESWDEAAVVAASVATGERTVLIDGGRDGRYLPTGHLAYGLNGVILAVPFDVGSRQVTGGPVPLVEGVRAAGVNPQAGALQWSVSSDGSLVYVPGSAGTGAGVLLVWVDRDGDDTVLPAPPRAYATPRVSPDGTRIAVEIAENENANIWIWDLEREALRQLTFDAGTDVFPLWTPDSARVVFTSSREGGGLFWKAADGTGQVELLHEFPAGVRAYSWSADGRLVFEQQSGDIGLLTMEGERAVEMLLDTEYSHFAPAVSPDGRWLAYASNETGISLIYVQPFPNIDGGKWLVSTNGLGFSPGWSPDGRELFFLNQTNMMVAQTETEPTFSARTPEPLFNRSAFYLAGDGRQWDIASDEDRFIFRAAGTALQTSDDESFNRLIFVENWFEELKARVPVP